ncbi:efflux RND transporter periplasmic adaptor subunit [Roseovarius tibetensis]|uniref:efflux RND transporter periplasmic adaptor subunit n=1 Tax=Roseovarius tibetensis TaxID=2685897 RepID=UPI003D7FAAC7
MRFLRQGFFGLFLLSMTLGLLAYAGQIVVGAVQDRMANEPRAPERQERVFAVRIVTATAEDISPTLGAYGEIKSRRTLEIRTQATGILTDLAADFVEGGAVQAGQFLARIDPADAEAALDRARIDLDDARAEAREAARALDLARDELTARRDQAELQERALARQRDLAERGAGTTAAVETAELSAVQARQAVLASRQALAAAEARVDQAETATARAELAVADAERRLAETRITAGFSGTLRDVTVIEGRLVTANEQMATLIDGTALEVAFRVSTGQYARLLDPDGALRRAPVTVTLDSGDRNVMATGRITRQSAAVAEGESGRVLYATLDDAAAMKPGDFVSVTVQEPPLTAVTRLPATALGPDGAVLALDDDDRLERLPVTLLRRQGNDILVRGAGLPGRDVVVERSPLLGPGIKVRPLTSGADAAQVDEDGTLSLSPDRRARLKAYVRRDDALPAAERARFLSELERPRVPTRTVKRLERRMGG